MKKTIQLSEKELHRLISESVKRVLRENFEDELNYVEDRAEKDSHMSDEDYINSGDVKRKIGYLVDNFLMDDSGCRLSKDASMDDVKYVYNLLKTDKERSYFKKYINDLMWFDGLEGDKQEFDRESSRSGQKDPLGNKTLWASTPVGLKSPHRHINLNTWDSKGANAMAALSNPKPGDKIGNKNRRIARNGHTTVGSLWDDFDSERNQ